MPKYAYRLRDQIGGLKTGVLEALDHRLAREDLIAAGWRVEELTPADPNARATPIPTPPKMVDFSEVFTPKAAPPPTETPRKVGGDLETALQDALKAEPAPRPKSQFSQRVNTAQTHTRGTTLPPPPSETLTPPPAWRLPVILTLIVVGLIVWIYQARAAAGPHGGKSQAVALHDVKVVVKGRLKLADVSGRPRGARVTLHLPQIPLDVTREGEELTLNSEGDFEIELAFQSARVPSLVEVSASKEGYRDAQVKGIALKGDPLSAEVPPIVLEPGRN